MTNAEAAKICEELEPFSDPSSVVDHSLTDAENKFYHRAKFKRGLNVYRAGWPDFLLEDPRTGEMKWVEVKAKTDELQQSQRRMFAALGRAGIAVYIWTPEFPERLIPWEQLAETRKRDRVPVRSGLRVCRTLSNGRVLVARRK